MCQPLDSAWLCSAATKWPGVVLYKTGLWIKSNSLVWSIRSPIVGFASAARRFVVLDRQCLLVAQQPTAWNGTSDEEDVLSAFSPRGPPCMPKSPVIPNNPPWHGGDSAATPAPDRSAKKN
jgi:hypothetical protein